VNKIIPRGIKRRSNRRSEQKIMNRCGCLSENCQSVKFIHYKSHYIYVRDETSGDGKEPADLLRILSANWYGNFHLSRLECLPILWQDWNIGI